MPYIIIDRDYLPSPGRRMTKCEARLDIIQMAVYGQQMDVERHGQHITLHNGQMLLSIRECMKRWEWGSFKDTWTFIHSLVDDGMIEPVSKYARAGTVYQIKGTLKGTLNNLETNELSHTQGTLKGTLKGTQKEIKIKKRACAREAFQPPRSAALKEKELPDDNGQWQRFERWAKGCIPTLIKHITPDTYPELLRMTGDDKRILAEALTYMESRRVPLQDLEKMMEEKPWDELE